VNVLLLLTQWAVKKINAALKELESNIDKHDSLFTINKIQTSFYREDLTPVKHNSDDLIPTQGLEPWYEENSSLFIFSKDSFAKTDARVGERPMIYVTPALESADIDELEGWEMASALAEHLVAIAVGK
jgi:CMP-N-acetylneuraminic acid synthetase